MTSEQEKQDDYKAYLANEKLLQKAAEEKRASTYLAHAMVDADSVGGRYAATAKASVVGSTPMPSYPRDGAGISWPQGSDELGYEIDAQEPTGEVFEQIEAQRILEQRSSGALLPPDDGGLATAVPTPSSVVERVAGPPSSQSSDALQSTPARAPASNLQRGAGARSFVRRL
jgi:hypothetical protein